MPPQFPIEIRPAIATLQSDVRTIFHDLIHVVAKRDSLTAAEFAAVIRDGAAEVTADLVAIDRATGRTWSGIAAALGTTESIARERFDVDRTDAPRYVAAPGQRPGFADRSVENALIPETRWREEMPFGWRVMVRWQQKCLRFHDDVGRMLIRGNVRGAMRLAADLEGASNDAVESFLAYTGRDAESAEVDQPRIDAVRERLFNGQVAELGPVAPKVRFLEVGFPD